MPEELEIMRNSHLVDPSLHIWGWEIPVYLFLGGLTAGLMILSALLSRRFSVEERSRWARWVPFAAPVLLSIGMFTLLLDLEYKLHVFRFYTAFRWTSPMSWGAWILMAIYPATILLGLAGLTRSELSRLRPAAAFAWTYELARRQRRLLEHANLWLGVALGGYTGILLGTLGARALWSSVLLGPLFLVSGLSAGAAFFLLFPITHEEHRFIRNWDVAAIGLELALITLFFLDLMSGGGEAGRRAAALLLGGAYTAQFWALVVIAGLLVPLYMEVSEARKKLAPSVVAPVLLLIGGLALRWILVSAGQVGL